MKRATLILAIYFFLSVRFISAQNNIYLGGDIGPTYPVYQYVDNGSYLYIKPFYADVKYGFNIERKLPYISKTSEIIIETGLYFMKYWQGFGIKVDYVSWGSSTFFTYQIPLRLKVRLKVKEKLRITGILGYTFAINNDYYFQSGYDGYNTDSGDSIYYVYTSYYNFRKTYSLIETGVTLEYHFKNSLIFYIAASYFTGFSRIIEIDVHYWVNDEPEQSATVFSNGDYFSFVLGLKYPISKLLKKEKKERGTILDDI